MTFCPSHSLRHNEIVANWRTSPAEVTLDKLTNVWGREAVSIVLICVANKSNNYYANCEHRNHVIYMNKFTHNSSGASTDWYLRSPNPMCNAPPNHGLFIHFACVNMGRCVWHACAGCHTPAAWYTPTIDWRFIFTQFFFISCLFYYIKDTRHFDIHSSEHEHTLLHCIQSPSSVCDARVQNFRRTDVVTMANV